MCHGTLQERRDVEIERKRAEEPARALGKDEDQREGGEYLIEMVAGIEPADDDNLHQGRRGRGGGKAGDKAEPEGTRRGRDRGAGEGADHVQRAVSKVDQPHHAEDQRQAGGDKEQHDTELEPVQKLLDEEGEGQGGRSGRSCGDIRPGADVRSRITSSTCRRRRRRGR